MPVRKIKIENDYDEEKSIPLASNHSITPIYVPLKQIFLVVMVIGFVYQASAIYQESIVQNKVGSRQMGGMPSRICARCVYSEGQKG